MYRHRFTVAGRGHFPIDMLRYDGAYPEDGQSVRKIHESVDMDRADDRSRRKIDLITVNDRADWVPTAGRWESFGWDVVEFRDTSRAG